MGERWPELSSCLNSIGKRELLARSLFWSGTTFLVSRLPERESLLVLNYHRIGNPDDDLFDPGIFSATADQLNEQITHLKKHVLLVTLEEALAFIEGSIREETRRCRVLLTFDDGYLDNYELAFPILQSHGVQGVFFLATSLVGSCHIPWWDHIAYLLKTARRRRFSLRYPSEASFDLDENGLAKSLKAVLKLFKTPENTDSVRFMRELACEVNGEEPPTRLRRFLSWNEAGEMIKGGMAFGSQTHSHSVLSQLSPDMQREELVRSRRLLKEQLGFDADVLAYPVGSMTSFTNQTQMLARDAGFRAAFSFRGGTNLRGKTSPYDVKRIGVKYPSWYRFRAQTAVCRTTGSYWP